MGSGAASERLVEPTGAASSVLEQLRASEVAPRCRDSAELSGNQPEIKLRRIESAIGVTSNGLDLLDPLPRRLIHPARSGSDRKVDMISTA